MFYLNYFYFYFKSKKKNSLAHMNYSQSELKFIKTNVLNGIRPDLRHIHLSRKIIISPFINTQADNSVEIILNQSHVIVSVQFIEQTPNQLINSNLILPDLLINSLTNTLQLHKVGMNIDLEIVNDDGNILYMLVTGLKHMLKSINVPDIGNLEQEKTISFDLPDIFTFAVFKNEKNEVFVVDPNKIEEESCDLILSIFCKNNSFSIVTYKSNCISKNILKEIMSNIKSSI